MRFMIMAAAVAALTFASTAEAASCKDAKGHFIKCPTPTAAPAKAAPCKDAKGHFIKCPAPAPTSMQWGVGRGKTTTPATAAAAAPKGAMKCKTGVPCGKSCIPKGKVCHK